jgi:hypothetical protein
MPASMMSADTGGQRVRGGQQHRDGRDRPDARQHADQRAQDATHQAVQQVGEGERDAEAGREVVEQFHGGVLLNPR